MKTLFCLFICIVPNIGFSQKIHTPSEIRRETTYHFGDFAQHAPALTALVVIFAKKDKMGFWQFTKSYGATLGLPMF